MSRASIVGAAAGLLLALTACTGSWQPTGAAMESLGMQAQQPTATLSRLKLRYWSEVGQATAQREWGLTLLREPGNVEQGLGWLQRAATGGDAEAGYVLGEAYRMGRYGLRPDAAAARHWFTPAAQAGHADAALSLSRLWRHGEGGARDEAQALHWLQQASERGSPQAMFLLSNAYAQGQGVAADLQRARSWLEAAADRHFGPALQAYALALEQGSLGLQADPAQARELMAEALEERRNRWNER